MEWKLEHKMIGSLFTSDNELNKFERISEYFFNTKYNSIDALINIINNSGFLWMKNYEWENTSSWENIIQFSRGEKYNHIHKEYQYESITIGKGIKSNFKQVELPDFIKSNEDWDLYYQHNNYPYITDISFNDYKQLISKLGPTNAYAFINSKNDIIVDDIGVDYKDYDDFIQENFSNTFSTINKKELTYGKDYYAKKLLKIENYYKIL